MEQVGAGEGDRRPPVYDSYARLSKVPETGELEKVETQQADNRAAIERRGGVLGEELSDGLSAWNRRVRRPGWERLLARVESGVSDGIVVWHTDRLFRQPRDLEALIELGERGFKVACAHGERDLAEPDDRFILRIEVAHAARSSDDTSRRIKRRFAAQRAAGRPQSGGPRRFGFPGVEITPSGPDGERVPVSAELVERERAAIRDAVAAILAGVSVGQIARDWNAAGLRTAAGREWVQVTVRETLRRPTLAGLIEHDGELVARMDGEAIIDQRSFERLRALFASRRRGRVAGERYLASGIARCGLCGNKLSAHGQPGKPHRDGGTRAVYWCNTQRRGCGRVYVDVRHLDRELREFTTRRLSDPRHAAALTAARSQTAQRLSEVQDEIAQCEALQQALSERLGRRAMSLDAFDRANEPLAADLARLAAERDTLTTGDAPGAVRVETVEAVATRWDTADNAERRAMLTQALGRQRVLVGPGSKTGKRTFDRSRIRVIDPDQPTDDQPVSRATRPVNAL